MKVLIDEDGRLHIERAGTYRQQTCPFSFAIGMTTSCGDWCPHFGEPVFFSEEIIDNDTDSTLVPRVQLTLCHNTAFYIPEEDLVDFRGEKKMEAGSDENENQDR